MEAGSPSHMWNSCMWSLIRMKFSLISISMPQARIAHWANSFWRMENSSPGLTFKCQNAGTLTAFVKGVVTWTCQSFNSVQEKQQSNTCTRTIIQLNGFWNSWFPWLLTIFSACAHCITHNVMYRRCIRIGNWFWNWTRSLFTQVNFWSLISCCRGLCEGVQVRQSLKDPRNITFTTSIFL